MDVQLHQLQSVQVLIFDLGMLLDPFSSFLVIAGGKDQRVAHSRIEIFFQAFVESALANKIQSKPTKNVNTLRH